MFQDDSVESPLSAVWRLVAMTFGIRVAFDVETMIADPPLCRGVGLLFARSNAPMNCRSDASAFVKPIPSYRINRQPLCVEDLRRALMFNFRNAAVVTAFAALIGASTPSYADGLWETAGDPLGWLAPGPPEVIYIGEPLDLSSPDWYRRWLYLRQNSSGAALYNQPCLVSNGYRERAVSCKLVAIAEAPPGAPLIVDAAPPVLERAPGRYYRSHTRHRYASIRARY
jgi:hypothetical protein